MRGSRVSSSIGALFLAAIAFTSLALPCVRDQMMAIGGMPPVAMWMVPALGGAYTSWAGEGTTSLALRALVASICLIPPTLLMGATLPAIARYVESTPRGVAWLGSFYGANIAGAAPGPSQASTTGNSKRPVSAIIAST